MAIAKVASNDAQASADGYALTIAVAYPLDLTAGNLLVCSVAWSANAAEPVVTDGLSQTWTKAVSVAYGTNGIVGIWYYWNTGATDSAAKRTVTATWALNKSYRRIVVSEFSGVMTAGDPIGKIKSAAAHFDPATDGVTTGNCDTPAEDGHLFFCADFMCYTSHVVMAAGTDFTDIIAAPVSSGANYYLQSEYFVQGSKAAHAGTWTNITPHDTYTVVLATFKPPAAVVTWTPKVIMVD